MLCSHLGMILLLMSITAADDPIKKKCANRICNHEAICELNNDKPICRCIGERYFAGEFCMERVDNCIPNPCQFGAACTNALGQPICGPCEDGFGGHFCDVAKAGLFTKMYLHHNRYGYFAMEERFLFTVESLGNKEFLLEFHGDNYAIDAFKTNPKKRNRWKKSKDLSKIAAENNLNHSNMMPYNSGYFYVTTARFWKVGIQDLQLRVSDIDTLKSYVNLAFTIQVVDKKNRCLPKIELNHCADPFNPLLLDIERFVTIEPVVRKRCTADSTMQFEWTVFNSVETALLYSYQRSYVPRLKVLPYPPWAKYRGDIVQSYMIRIGITEITSKKRTYLVKRCYVFVYTKPVIASITGGTQREMNAGKTIQLDASKSRDLGMPPYSQEKLIYRWSCSSETDANNTFCSSLSKKDKIFNIPAGKLKIDMTYKFKLVVRSQVNQQNTDSTTQTIQISPDMSLIVDIECVRNCLGRKFTPGIMIHLKARCLNCKSTAERKYSWTVIGGVANKVDKKRLIIEKPASVPLLTATILYTSGKVQGTSNLQLEQNNPPAGGICKIDPTSGKEYETDFRISCNNFMDDEQPLTYEFWAESFILDRTSESITQLRLPKTNEIRITICDALHACIDEHVDVNVEELDINDIESTLKEEKTNLKMLLRNGDFNRAMILARRLIPHINSSETVIFLVDHLRYMKLANLLDIEQYIPIVGDIIEKLPSLKNIRVVEISILIKILADSIKTCLLDNEIYELKIETYKLITKEIVSMLKEIINNSETLLEVQTLAREHVNTVNRLAEKFITLSEFDADILTKINSWLISSKEINQCIKYIGLCASYVHEPGEPKIQIENEPLLHKLLTIEEGKNLTIETEDSIAKIVMSTKLIHNLSKVLLNRKFLLQIISMSDNPFWWYPDQQKLSTGVLYFSGFSRNLHVEQFGNVNLENALEFYLKVVHENNDDAKPSPALGYLKSNTDMNIFMINVPKNALLIIRFISTTLSLRILLEMNIRSNSYYVKKSSRIIDKTMPKTTVMIRNEEGNDGIAYLGVIAAVNPKNENISFSFIPELRECLSWSFNRPNPQWSTIHCKPAIEDSSNELHCFCQHMSIYAGKIFPTTAYSIFNVGNLLSELPVNWYLILVEILIAAFFLSVALIAYLRLDRNRDNLVTAPKGDNFLEERDKDKEIIVRINTGGNRNAATTAGILLTFSTTDGPRKYKIYQNPQRPHLLSNTTCTVKLPIDPDTLEHPLTVVIKHDSGGRYPTWYCRSLEISYKGAAKPIVIDVEHWIAEKTVQVSATTDQLTQSETKLMTNQHKRQTFCNILEMHYINWNMLQPFFGPWKCGNSTCNRLERSFILIAKIAVTVIIVFYYYGWTTMKNYEAERKLYRSLTLNPTHLFILVGVSFVVANFIQFGIEFWLFKSTERHNKRALFKS